MEHVEVIHKELVRDGVCLKFYKDTVKVPGVGEKIYDSVEHKFNAAATVPVMPDGRILLVHQYRPALSKFTWEIPAGARDSLDEDPLVCAKRELLEETGHFSDDFSFLMKLHPAVAYSSELIDVYIARDVYKKGSQHLDEDEFIDVKAWEYDTLLEMIRNGEIDDSKTIAGILAVKTLV